MEKMKKKLLDDIIKVVDFTNDSINEALQTDSPLTTDDIVEPMECVGYEKIDSLIMEYRAGNYQ